MSKKVKYCSLILWWCWLSRTSIPYYNEKCKQAGAELGQAQVKLEVLVYIGVKVEVEN